MQNIEITAKSVDEAKAQAAAKLGVDPSQISVTVLEETKGLFGKTNVKVRAEVVSAAPAEEKPAKPSRSRAPKAKAEAAPAPEPEPVAAPEPEKPAAKPARGKKAQPPKEAAPAAEETGGGEIQATQEDADHFIEVMTNLLSKTGLEVNAKCSGYSGKYVNVQFDGKDTGYLVGKHGEVLNSFQYLTNIIAAQQWGNGIRAVLDGNDYRSRREEQLTHLATKIAEEVAKRGEEAVLDALPAFERRIVHKAISEMSGVTTYSEGEEPNRRVVIAPAD